MREKNISSDFPSKDTFSGHTRSLSKTTCLVLWLKFPPDLPPTYANSIGSGETARMRRLARTFAVRICYC